MHNEDTIFPVIQWEFPFGSLEVKALGRLTQMFYIKPWHLKLHTETNIKNTLNLFTVYVSGMFLYTIFVFKPDTPYMLDVLQLLYNILYNSPTVIQLLNID